MELLEINTRWEMRKGDGEIKLAVIGKTKSYICQFVWMFPMYVILAESTQQVSCAHVDTFGLVYVVVS